MRKKTFTLAEVLVSAFIFLIISGGIAMVLQIGDISWQTDAGMLELQQTARRALDGMTREIRQGRNIVLTSGGSAINFDIIRFDYNETTGITTNTTYSIAYSLNNNQIIRQHAGATTIVANDIDNVCFCWNNNACGTSCASSDVFPVRLLATKTVRQRPLSFSLAEKVRLRNE